MILCDQSGVRETFAKLVALDRESRLGWIEFRNKLEAFTLFERIEDALDLRNEGCQPLRTLVGRAMALGTYPSVWAIEGVGHHFAESMWRGFGPPRGLLREHPAPERAALPLHAGMGMCFSVRAIEAAGRGGSIPRTLEAFESLCRSNAAPEFFDVSFETLGLAARTLRPELALELADRLAPELSALFWHGVGRGAYFAPANFAPFGGARERVFQEAARAPSEIARAKSAAGTAWAFTLVNIRNPEVAASLLESRPDLAQNRPFRQGMSAAHDFWSHFAHGKRRLLRRTPW